MTAQFWITTAAIVLGPVVAVIITFLLQKRSDLRQRKLFVFRSLMTTRKTPLSPERVQALNLVEVEFHKEKNVLDKFERLLRTYNDQVRWRSDDTEIRNEVIKEVDDRTAELLREMGSVLGYRLENLDLLRGGYYPEAFSTLEKQQEEIREFLVGLNKGIRHLPTAVVDVRHPQKILDQARETDEVLKAAARDERGFPEQGKASDT
ncbi:DUF6680 family protein [Roseovarius sp. D22-M7]|uniref:DUF6680 family protein n=1 Tax=Roseovarius sp. D22-M7 TaxID=3127116 RepID=UPI00301011E6